MSHHEDSFDSTMELLPKNIKEKYTAAVRGGCPDCIFVPETYTNVGLSLVKAMDDTILKRHFLILTLREKISYMREEKKVLTSTTRN